MESHNIYARTWCSPFANPVHVGSISEFINFAFIDLGGLAFLTSSIPSCSDTLSPSSSVGFPELWGKGFAGNTPFEAECSTVSHSLAQVWEAFEKNVALPHIIFLKYNFSGILLILVLTVFFRLKNDFFVLLARGLYEKIHILK